MENFGDWIKAEIGKRNWIQADLARASSLDSAVISNLINGKRGPGEDTCTAIAHALNLSPDAVFRAAGLLPPVPTQNQTIDEMSHILSQLSPEDQEELLAIARYKLEKQKDKTKPIKHRREGTTPPEVVKMDN